jgi:WD40 repeat protein
VASADFGPRLLLWQRGREAPRELAAVDRVFSSSFSPDGRQLAWLPGDGTVRVEPVDGGTARSFRGHRALVRHVAFSPDSDHVVSESDDRTARIWSLRNGASKVLPHESLVVFAGFSADGKTVATLTATETINVWDVVSGAELAVYRADHGTPLGAAIAPSRRWVAAVYNGESFARLWPLDPEPPRRLDDITTAVLGAGNELESVLSR